MKSFPPSKIRNVALVGHTGAGKTSLAEAILFEAGATGRLGRVEEGTTVCDFEPEETKRHLSVSLAVASFERSGYKINLIDTPGYADFSYEVASALSVADLAVFVVSASDGIGVGTEEAWELAAREQIPRLFFINKLDREQADFSKRLEELRGRFGSGIAPLELPLLEAGKFIGIVDLLRDKALIYEAKSLPPQVREGPIPAGMNDEEHAVREALVEGIVVGDDSLMERYLEGESIEAKELEEALAKGVASASVFPVITGSATSLIGVDRLVDLICELAPSPEQRPPVRVIAGDEVQEVRPDASSPVLARVFRTFSDPYLGKVSYLKVLSGTLRPDTVVVCSRTHQEERIHALARLKGKDQEPVPEAPAGDIVAVARLGDVATGDTLAQRGMPVVLPAPTVPDPTYSIAIRPKSKGDEDKLMTAIHRLQEEDPCLKVERVSETHQTVLSGTGDSHLQIAIERLKRKFGVEVETEELLVPYRETITQRAEAEGRHKKQTGGHGQFGVADIRIAPLPRGEGFVFHDEIVGGAIPRQFIPAVEKGIVEQMAQGVIWGYPVVDVEVTLYDGKYHPVDSSEMSFKLAGALAFREAMAKAGPVLLEPISRLEVVVPASLQGDVLGDLNARRGRVLGTESIDGSTQRIVALVPTSEILRYAIDLRSLTGGRGRFSATHDRYEILPPHLMDKVPKKNQEK